jgi:predicted ribosome quality control (RQC) complex YloA/Tae2 family protein
MTFVVTFQFRGKREVHKRLASSLKIDGQGALILYDKNRGILENLTISELSDLSIEPVRSRAARSGS